VEAEPSPVRSYYSNNETLETLSDQSCGPSLTGRPAMDRRMQVIMDVLAVLYRTFV